MATGGYIKLYRSMLDWGWYGDGNTARVFLHLLLTANYEDSECLGYKVPRGSAVCSIPGISSTVNLSIQQVRTAIEHLKSTGEITVTKTPKFSIIAVSKYDEFQSDNSQFNSQATVKQQSSNSQATTSKEIKKRRNKEINIKDGNAGASYDIEKAVAVANSTVPTVKKREAGRKTEG